MKTIRDSAGYYRVYHNRFTVTVLRNPELQGSAKWIAYASWDKYLVADPVFTKAEAIKIASGWIDDELAAANEAAFERRTGIQL